MKSIPNFKKQTKKEKALTILYYVFLIATLVLIGLSYGKIIKDYIWIGCFSVYLLVSSLRVKGYNSVASKRNFILFIVSIILFIVDFVIE